MIMTYTIKIDYWMHDDKILTEEELKLEIQKMLNSVTTKVIDFQLLDVND